MAVRGKGVSCSGLALGSQPQMVCGGGGPAHGCTPQPQLGLRGAICNPVCGRQLVLCCFQQRGSMHGHGRGVWMAMVCYACTCQWP
jgi:hypothetical protein